ncbi:MAG: extracellular solute-binding protein [Eubacteriales bacterium]|nr:extracellular solute-binding protein [Eubacteriales bacterium]
MRKKAELMGLAGTMALALALCGGMRMEAAAEGEEVGLIAAWWGSQDRNDKFTKAFDTYTENNPNITFELQINTFSDHLTALSASAASNTMPDLAMLQTAYLKTYTDAEKLLDLTPYIESGALDMSNVDENVLATGKVGEGIYGISAGNNAASIIYNKTLLEENGIEVKNLMNMEEFVGVCQEIYEKTGVRTQIDNISTWLEFISRANGTGLFEGNALGAGDAEIFVPFFEMIETGREEGWLLDQGIVTANGTAVEEQAVVKYTSAETQSWCSGFNSNQMVAMQAAAPEGVELDLITVPCDDPSTSYYVRQAMCWTIAAGSEHIDEAVAVLNWWINSEEANAIIMGEPGVPANNEIAAYVADMLDETTAKTFNYVADVVIPNSSAGDPPAEAGASQVLDLANEVYEKVAYGEMTAEEAAAEFFEQGNTMMANAAS